MPSIWIILAVAVGALNLHLLTPAIAAYFGYRASCSSARGSGPSRFQWRVTEQNQWPSSS